MRHDLVAEEIEVDPLLRAAAFRTPQNGAIKMTRSVEIVDGESKMKWSKRRQSWTSYEEIVVTSHDTCDLNRTVTKTLVIPLRVRIARPFRYAENRIDLTLSHGWFAIDPRGLRTIMTACFTISRAVPQRIAKLLP